MSARDAAARAGRVRALVLAAGAGTRLRPLTDTVPKCLVPIAGRPLLEYWLDALARAGVRDIWVNTHAHADQVSALFARLNARDASVRVHALHEPELLGSAGTIARNPEIGDGASEVIVVYADNFSTLDVRALQAHHRAHSAEFTMALFHAENPRACGIAELDAAGRVAAFVEKPERPASDLANAGIYVLSGRAYREIAEMRAFDLGFEVIPRFVGRIHGFVHDGYHLDVGTHETYARARGDAAALVRRWGQNAGGRRRAVFLDRDGTLIERVHYLDDPDAVRLVADCGTALRALRDAGFALVVVTNQAAVGKGLLDLSTLARIHERMFELLAAEGVCIDAIYSCAIPGRNSDRTRIEHPDRKPGPGMLLRARDELALSLERSYMIGDMISDVLAGEHAGCRASLLLDDDSEPAVADAALSARFPRFARLTEACDWIRADVATAADAGRACSAAGGEPRPRRDLS